MRKKKLLLNSVTSLFGQCISVICGFLTTRFILTTFGSDINGLVSSITQFLSFITFLEMGIGAVVKSALYKPLSDKDEYKISLIVASTKRFYRKIATILIIYTIALAVIYPFIENSEFDFLFTATLVLIISISLFAQYYFGTPYQLLLNADQKTYIPTLLNTGTLLISTVLSVTLMFLGASIHIVKLCISLVYILRPFGLNLYVRKYYDINEKIKVETEPLTQKWDGIAQHIAYVVLNNTDVAVLTVFSTLANVSIYSVYHNVLIGVQQIISCVSIGASAAIGNVLYSENKDILHKDFFLMEWLFHVGTILLFTITGIMIIPFVAIYTSDVTDTNYILPVFAVLITLAQASYSIRIPYETIVLAANKFKETKVSAIIEAVLNIVISIIFVSSFGLSGVAIGTLFAMSYRTLYFVYYLHNNILIYPYKRFAKLLLEDVLQVVLCVIVCSTMLQVDISKMTWELWIFQATETSIICIIICFIVNYLFERQMIESILHIGLSRG